MFPQASKEPEGDEHTIVTVENPAAVPQEDVVVPYENKVRYVSEIDSHN